MILYMILVSVIFTLAQEPIADHKGSTHEKNQRYIEHIVTRYCNYHSLVTSGLDVAQNSRGNSQTEICRKLLESHLGNALKFRKKLQSGGENSEDPLESHKHDQLSVIMNSNDNNAPVCNGCHSFIKQKLRSNSALENIEHIHDQTQVPLATHLTHFAHDTGSRGAHGNSFGINMNTGVKGPEELAVHTCENNPLSSNMRGAHYIKASDSTNKHLYTEVIVEPKGPSQMLHDEILISPQSKRNILKSPDALSQTDFDNKKGEPVLHLDYCAYKARRRRDVTGYQKCLQLFKPTYHASQLSVEISPVPTKAM